jgi:peptidoglycan/LPS O-acetylase OafA/YrhL
MSSLPEKPFKREIELDFVRGLAILMVIDFHSPHTILLIPFSWLGFRNFGWIGVDIFFVLSGFLVGGLLVKEWKVRGRIDSRQFLIRRGFKIWPQYYVFLLLMLLTGHRTVRELWGNLLNIQNYVGGVAHTWSLAVEEHAYLLLVLCLAIAARQNARMRHLFLFLLAVVVVVITLQFTLILHGYNVFARTHTRIDGILEGVMLAMLYHYAPTTFRRLQQQRWAWFLVLIAALTFLRFQPMTLWSPPIAWNFANAIGIALMMLLYHHREGYRRPALYRFIAWIGLYSYGIYLWHVSVVSFIVSWARHLPIRLQPAWEALAAPEMGILLGIAFTKLVEFTALRLRDRLYPRRVDSAVGIPAEIEEKALSAAAVQSL